MHDRIGEAIPEAHCPCGVFLNPKNCEFGNASFLGIRKDGVLCFPLTDVKSESGRFARTS